MNLITLENISLAYGLDILLDKAKLTIETNERICLIGRNGAGKSSLLKIIEGNLLPDTGQVWRKPHLRIARLEQELPHACQKTVFEYVAMGLAEIGDLLTRYHTLTHALVEQSSERALQELDILQREIESKNGWQYEQAIERILTRLALPADKLITDLSGGWQRRAALAKALVMNPDVLLLDEPTNHLDIEAIQWLEEELLNCPMSLVFITHDRALLQRLATRIIELDRGQLTSWPGDYANFLRRKEEMLHAEAKHHADFDKKLQQEEKWIRQGIKARRTRNEGRVRALQAMRRERAERRTIQGKVAFQLNEAEQSGQLVIEAKNISHHFGEQTILQDFSVRIMRGDRIGLIGPNGVGKSTLLNILLGQLQPDQGTLHLGTKLEVAYFDQLRAGIDSDKTVIDNVAQGKEIIEINGKRQHIISYLGDFLFSPQRAMTPVKALSGGECNRLLLARLFSQPANLFVLDEPTNDLDVETLELLEALLTDFKGTLLIVSHDRAFLDNVVTSTLVFEGNGIVKEYVGGYSDWQQQVKHEVVQPESPATQDKETNIPKRDSKKLSFKDQKELNELPDKIEKLETELSTLQTTMAAKEFYQQSPDKITLANEQLSILEQKLSDYYQRWDSLLKKSTS